MQHQKKICKIPSYFYYINNQFWFNTIFHYGSACEMLKACEKRAGESDL